MKSSFHHLRSGAWTIIGCYLLICGALWRAQRHLIFFPSRIVNLTPKDFGVSFENVQLRINTGEALRGWWIPSDGERCALIYLHGNGGNISANAEQGARLAGLGCSVFLFDYRGYGGSDGGFPSESSVYVDGEAAWRYMTREQHFQPQQITLYGHSLGGAIAIELALHHPDAKGLIVESSFTSVRDAANEEPLYRAFPITFILTQHFDSIHKVPEIRVPVLFIHGTADTTVPPRMSERLYAAANQPKRLVFISGGHHDDSAEIGGQEYLTAIARFLGTARN